MKIAIASDHAGFKLKELIKKTFADINFEDFGCFSEESADYPDFIPKAARAVRDDLFALNVVILIAFELSNKVTRRISVRDYGVFELANFRLVLVTTIKKHNIKNSSTGIWTKI